MLIADADYPFLDIFWTMLIFFAWVAWISIVINVFIDLFRRDDVGGWGKAGWVVFVIAVPFLGVLVYLIAQHDGMRDRSLERARADKRALDDYARDAASGPAAEISQAKELLDKGAISQEEFETLKAKSLS
jgi:hypothetical protein